MRFVRALTSAWYWIKHRVWRRFDRVYIRTLSPDYHDKDDIFLHACFQILVDWVEREKGLDWWGHGEETAHGVTSQELNSSDEAHREMKALYDWWTGERPKRYIEPPTTILLTGSGTIEESDNTTYLENIWEDEDQRNLERLVKFRNSLWT